MKNNIVKTGWFWIFIGIALFSVVILIFINMYILDSKEKILITEWYTYIIDILGILATVELGYIAIWQNKRYIILQKIDDREKELIALYNEITNIISDVNSNAFESNLDILIKNKDKDGIYRAGENNKIKLLEMNNKLSNCTARLFAIIEMSEDNATQESNLSEKKFEFLKKIFMCRKHMDCTDFEELLLLNNERHKELFDLTHNYIELILNMVSNELIKLKGEIK